ncbi:MAG TPA: four helix bundle protein [Puia sp.]|jgi:four helix bundle protein|nr:four helix bundle protein [Puia sp.]
MREGPIVKKSLEFSILVVNYCELLESKRKFIIANQLLKSGTSIGANVFEAQHSESRLDFTHKMKIALKEANETFYWLSLCEKMSVGAVPPEALNNINEIIAILSRIIITCKKNLNSGK